MCSDFLAESLVINASNHGLVQGHPNENIVQNHLNIALLKVF